MRSSILSCVSLVLSLACTERAAKPSEPKPSEPAPGEPAPGEPQPSEPQPDAKPSDAIDLFAASSEVLEQVRNHWCASGGETFRPPGSPDEEWPPRLAACTDIDIKVHSQLERDGLRAELVTLSASFDSRELLLLQSAEHAALLELYQDVEDTSGEGGTYLRKRERIELRDLTGTPTPEWIAEFTVSGGDSFEADRCFANHEDHRSLIVCSESASGLACSELEYWATRTSTPRPEDLDECGTPVKELGPATISGFAQKLELARDRIVLAPAKLAIDEPEEPPYAGEVSLATFLAEPLEALAAASRP